MAVVNLFPGAQLVEGGATEFGFFYDVHAEQPIDEQGLILLEESMRGLIKSGIEIRKIDMMRENAANFLEHRGQTFKADAVHRAKSNIVSLLQIGDFSDYAPSTYPLTTQEVGAFKLLGVETTTHYLEDEGECLVKRIHGTAFPEKQSLKKYLKARTASLKHDYRKIAEHMQLFSIAEEISDRAWLWLPNGTILKDLLIDWWKKEHYLRQFLPLSSPKLVKESLILKAGAYGFSEEAYTPHSCEIDGVAYVVPPTLTPVHTALFLSKNRATNQLPVRYAEIGTIIPGIKTGHYRGLLHSNLVEADFAHVFCNFEYLEAELISSLQFIDKIIKMFGFEYYWCFTEYRHKNRVTGGFKEKAQLAFLKAFDSSGLSYTTGEPEEFFEGPIACAKLIDSYGREWNGPKIGIDFRASEFLKGQGQAADRTTSAVLVIVQSLFGSLERFVALLVEHCSGKLPLWLAPEQVRVAVVGDSHRAYAEGLWERLRNEGYRAGINASSESLSKKVHEAQELNIPYLLVVGEKEENSNQVTLRSSTDETHQQMMTIEELLNKFRKEVLSKQNAIHGDEKTL